MKTRFPLSLLAALSLALLAPLGAVRADDPAPPPAAAAATSDGTMRRLDDNAAATAAPEKPDAPEAAADTDADEAADATPAPAPAPAPKPAKAPKASKHRHDGRSGDNNERVTFGGDSTLREGEQADAVVSIFGSSTSAGEVKDAVVSILGSTRVTGGSVGDSAVAVLGNNYVNAHVRGEVVAVLGDVELGPDAVVDGQIVCVGGHLIRDPAAVTHGNVQNVSIMLGVTNFDWLHSWVEHCLLLGRPLAFAPHLGWIWLIALGMLALYVLLGAVAPAGVEKCIKTLEERPGHTLLAAVLVTLLTPVAAIILIITIVGLPALILFLIGAAIFGKAVLLAWIGRRLLMVVKRADGAAPAIALSVLVGGLLVLLLYTVPFLGFVLSKLLSWLGVGTVVYTIILSMKRAKPAIPLVPPTPPSFTSAAPVVPPVTPAPESPATPIAPAGGESSAASLGAVAAPSVAGIAAPLPESVPPGAAASVPAAATAGAVPPPAAAVPPPSPPPVMPAPVRPVFSVATLPRAGFWIRILASLLDAILIGLVLAMLPHVLQPNYLLLYGAYCAVMWALKGTTIGGVVCGLKVVRLDDRPVDWMTGLVRALGGFLSLCVAGLGFIWVAYDDEKQSWHDKIAGTTVVLVPKGVSLL